MTTTTTERRCIDAALEHPCPNCGAKAGVRCRFVTRGSVGSGYPAKTKVDVRRKPCNERVEVAWRAELADQREPKTSEATEGVQSAFTAGAMWAACELGHPEDEAVTFLERAQARAQEGYADEATDAEG